MMNFLHSEIGSAKDNMKSPIHNWYKFTAGFSYKFVEEIIKYENLKINEDNIIFDPFAGCGTTLVSAQKEGVKAIGNEAQTFMYDIIKAKINWEIDSIDVYSHLKKIKSTIISNINIFDIENNVHPLLMSLYDKDKLIPLYIIKKFILEITSLKYQLFFKLALSQTLHKVALHPIAVPYISRNRNLNNELPTWDVFNLIVLKMLEDSKLYQKQKNTSIIYNHDSRKPNRFINDNSCHICITSPPYLNNLDYGEVSKVHTHFFNITSSWNDITNNVRKKLVTGAITHYINSEFSMDSFVRNEFSLTNENILPFLIQKSEEIKKISKTRSGRKSFDILMMHYFNDMFHVIKEIRRVVYPKGKAYMILGDSAPYGVHIPTTEILGKIACNTGFNDFEIVNIRSRGSKWKNLKYRHNLVLSENVLIIK